MKPIIKNVIFILSSTFLIALVFATGFYFGDLKNNITGNKANASVPADLNEFWQVWNLMEEKFVSASTTETVSTEEKVYGAIRGLVSSYEDPYSVFLPPKENKEFTENIRGNFEGVGMEIGIRDDLLTVISPIKDTPAYKAGLKSGDRVLEINGQSTSGMTLEKAVSLIRGEKGTFVELLISREGEESFKVSLQRDVIKLPTIDTELRSDGIFVISLYTFTGQSDKDFREALREFLLSKSNKLLLDLRGNPGGYLDSAVDIASWFLSSGKVVVTENFADKKEEKVFRSKGYNIFNNNLKMAILVNGGSASASEIVAGALQQHGVATLVGTKTFGKGSVQELIQLPNETSLKVTVARWLTPNGTSISDGGLTPDVEVEITKEDTDNEVDIQLEKAIDILLNK
ncbi:S41 family peptidase [Candidatus Nomurabacteria bacterium]|nr:S41 family peptidase [Candidatus Nomurabacteria bacterium]